MIMLVETNWGAGTNGASSGNNYEIGRQWVAHDDCGCGFFGDDYGDGVGFDISIQDDISDLYDPLQFEQLVTNAALQITWSTACKRNKSL